MNCKLCFQPFNLQDDRKLPRVLTQCGHTFCDHCIRKNMNNSQQFICKGCNKANIPLQDGSFPLNQTLISILQRNQQGLCQLIKESQFCKVHGKKLEAYCENDQKLLCLNCILTEHKSHKILPILQKVQKEKEILKTCEQSIHRSQQILKKKQQQCASLVDRLHLDFNEYVFEINLLYKSIISQLKESEENFISQTKKKIDKWIKQVQANQNLLKEKISFFTELMTIYEDLNLKSGVQFINQNNKKLFLIENCSIKQNFVLPYKKQEIQKQKVLNQTIKSIQQLLIFQKKKSNSTIDKKGSIIPTQINSQTQSNSQQTKKQEKCLKSNGKDDSFSRSMLLQSPSRMQKKTISSVQKVSKETQILQVNLMEKYAKHQQTKNMKKRNSDILISKGKSPRIEYEVRRQIDLSQKNPKHTQKDIQRQQVQMLSGEMDFQANRIIESDKSLTNSKFYSIRNDDFALSFLNESHIIASPKRQEKPNKTFQIQTPLSINSFMESSQCTVFQENKNQTLLKDSAASFTIFCTDQKIFHFGGLKNDSIVCHKVSNNTNLLTLTEQNCTSGLSRSKAQCLIMRNYHPKKCLILGGKDHNSQRSNLIFSYDMENNRLQKCPFELNEAISGFGAIVNNDKLFIFGGSSFSALKTLHEYRLTKNGLQVRKLSPMMNSRDQLGFALGFDGYLYVSGGINSSNVILNSCQRYCFKTNKWSSIAAMKNPRRSFTLVSLPNGLYAIGGHDGKSFLKSVEMYDFESEDWVEVASLNQARFTHTALCTGDYQNIIVLGGFQNQPLKTVEVYDTIQNRWLMTNEMSSERYLHCSILVQE